MRKPLNGQPGSAGFGGPRASTVVALAAVFGAASIVPASTPMYAASSPPTGASLLAAESDAAASLDDVLHTASDNAADVADHFFEHFFPALQQETVHRLDLISQMPEDPVRFFTFVGDVADEMGTGMDAHCSHFVPPDGDDSDLYGSLNEDHLGYLDSYTDALDDDSATALDFFASPMSGILAGIFTPYLGAGLALVDDTIDVFESSITGDIDGAVQSALDEPTDFIDAFFNGYGDLDISVPVSDLIPGVDSDDTVTSINLGGLFSTGGSVFNSLGIDGDDSSIGGEGFGEFGSLVSIQDAIAVAVGWDGDGNPIAELDDVDGFGWLGNLLDGLL